MIDNKGYMRTLTGGGKITLLRSIYVLILFVFACVGMMSCAKATSAADSKPESAADYVIICTGPMATTYHRSDDCEGLQNCNARIDVVTREEAEKQGRRACRYCYE